MVRPIDGNLNSIVDKVITGERLTYDDGCALLESRDIHSVGQLANHVRERINGNYTFYNVNTHINPTNICVYKCDFCAFRAGLDDPRGYVMTQDQIVQAASDAWERGVTELHLVGGMHHKLPFTWYCDVLSWIRDEFPDIHLKAYTAVEILWFAQIAKLSIAEIITQLKDAGLGSLPGGGAEIFHPEVREEICGQKATAEEWLEIHETAHELGLRSNATMLYGHIEKPHHRVDHMVRLRELQDRTGGFQTFIPLQFHPENTRMADSYSSSGITDLKTMAVSRLMLDNFPHIKAYWISLGMRTAQIALSFGADDVDGTVVHEKIYHDAGTESPEELTTEQLRNMIREAGRVPIERDTLYHRIDRHGTTWHRREPIAVSA